MISLTPLITVPIESWEQPHLDHSSPPAFSSWEVPFLPQVLADNLSLSTSWVHVRTDGQVHLRVAAHVPLRSKHRRSIPCYTALIAAS